MIVGWDTVIVDEEVMIVGVVEMVLGPGEDVGGLDIGGVLRMVSVVSCPSDVGGPIVDD